MKKKYIMKEMITKKIKYILDDLDENLNQNKISFSSENAFVFHFAWQLFKEYESFIDSVDFEVSLFEGFSDGKFIDLLVCFKNNNQITKVGFEFKFPKKENKGGTDARRSIINDIKRLTWLVEKKKIDIGVFICATNDDYFIKKDGKRVALEFATHHKKFFKQGHNLPTDKKYPETVKSLIDITFNWNHLVKEKKGLNIEPGKYSFLEPISVL
jgi:hypothetical protein